MSALIPSILDKEERKGLVLSVGTHKGERPLAPVEVAERLQRLLDGGVPRREVSEWLGIGTSQIGSFLKLLRLSPEIRALADWGQSPSTVPFSSLAEIAKLPPESQVEAAEYVLRHELAWKEVIALVQLYGRAGSDLHDAIQQVLRLRPEVVQHYVYIARVLSAEVQGALRAQGQRDRDQVLYQVVSRVLPGVEVSVRCGDTTLVISADTSIAAEGASGDEVEHDLNVALEEAVLG